MRMTFSASDNSADAALPSTTRQASSDIEKNRSAVRRRVTYAVIYAYLGLAVIVVVWLMWAGRYEVAIGVLGGVAGLAGSISGFWFGSRRPSQPRE